MPKAVLCYDDYFSRYGKLNTFRCPLPGFSLTIVLLFLRWLKTVPSTFEDLEFDGSLSPSWQRKPAQLLVNKLLSILWLNRLP